MSYWTNSGFSVMIVKVSDMISGHRYFAAGRQISFEYARTDADFNYSIVGFVVRYGERALDAFSPHFDGPFIECPNWTISEFLK